LEERHSVRAFKDKAVEEEKIKKILQALNSAPSAGDLQAFEVLLVKSQDKKEALLEAGLRQQFLKEAGFILVFSVNPERSAKYGERGAKLYCVQDATIACAYAQLAATDLGLGSVWVGAFDEQAVKKALDIEKGLTPIALLPIGYPAQTPKATPRRELSDLVKEIE
jgi:nitroreductase